jgi:poly-gamma-glutamate system protein
MRFSLHAGGRLLLLAIALAALWHLAGRDVMSSKERLLWEKTRAAQHHLSEWRRQNGSASTAENDPWNCGLIGVEWSSITTTLGHLASKRTACNPAWAVQFSRWFDQSGLGAGDHIVIYSSASFPGLLLNAITAAEAMALEPLLVVSLGASTWGANHTAHPWPVLATELRSAGFIRTRADFYTLGGGDELGHGLAPEGLALLHDAADQAGIELLMADDLEEMISRKTELLKNHKPRLFISIGGSHANLGNSPDVLRLHTGPVSGPDTANAGNGIIGEALRNDIPVIHMLNIKSLSQLTGIPYDRPPRITAPANISKWWSGAGLVLFLAVVLTHRRWRLEETEE